jgi:phenol 2-monooxygenase
VFLEGIKKRSDLKIERGVEPVSMDLDHGQVEDTESYPVTMKLRHIKRDEVSYQPIKSHWRPIKNGHEKNGMNGHQLDFSEPEQNSNEFPEHEWSEIVHAKYVLGCEGAHSWTRRQLGFQMEGDTTDSVWGVMDVVLNTDWPEYVS